MKTIFTSAFIIFFSFTFAQCPAPEVMLKERPKTKVKDPYSVNSQSRSGSVTSDSRFEMSFIAQQGMDYRLTTKPLKGAVGSVSYEVYEMVVEKKMENNTEVFKRVKRVLASSNDAGADPLEFTTDKTRKVFVSMSLTGGDKKKPVCVGILLEDKRATKLGFE